MARWMAVLVDIVRIVAPRGGARWQQVVSSALCHHHHRVAILVHSAPHKLCQPAPPRDPEGHLLARWGMTQTFSSY
eukprot:7579001-Pyramimonas_sp.AAC.2